MRLLDRWCSPGPCVASVAEDGQRPPGPAGVVDEGVLEVQAHDVPGQRRQRFDRPGAARSPKSTMTSSSRWPTSQAWTRPAQPGNAGGRPANSSTILLTLSLKCSVGQSTREHAVDQDADPVGDPLDVGEDVRAEEDRPPPALDQVDHRHQEVAASDRVEPQRRVVEDEQVGIGGDRQRQGDVGALAVRQPAELRPRRGSRSGRGPGRASADSSDRHGTSGRTARPRRPSSSRRADALPPDRRSGPSPRGARRRPRGPGSSTRP